MLRPFLFFGKNILLPSILSLLSVAHLEVFTFGDGLLIGLCLMWAVLIVFRGSVPLGGKPVPPHKKGRTPTRFARLMHNFLLLTLTMWGCYFCFCSLPALSSWRMVSECSGVATFKVCSCLSTVTVISLLSLNLSN